MVFQYENSTLLWPLLSNLKARINSIGKARENSIVKMVKKGMKKMKRMLKFFLEIIIKEGLLDDRNSYVYNNRNTMEKTQE
jgi:hypothetical protein